jgi:hypothetical protein
MMIGKYKPSQIRKAIVAGVGLTAQFINLVAETFATMPPGLSKGLTVGIGVCTVVGVFLTKNDRIIDMADEL